MIEKLLLTLSVDQAFLFGSASVGKNTSDSDLDILIVIPDSEIADTYYKSVNKAFFSPVAVDWIIKKKSDFEMEKEIGGVSRVAYLTGKRIYPIDSK